MYVYIHTCENILIIFKNMNNMRDYGGKIIMNIVI